MKRFEGAADEIATKKDSFIKLQPSVCSNTICEIKGTSMVDTRSGDSKRMGNEIFEWRYLIELYFEEGNLIFTRNSLEFTKQQ